jgi:hypothetical protein
MRSKTIFLPNGDFSNDKYWKLCSGWICHEGGHNRYTEIETTVDFENEYLSKQPGFECIMPDGTASFSSKEEEKKAEIKLRGFIVLLTSSKTFRWKRKLVISFRFQK